MYNFDATPIGPTGSCMLTHNKATLQRSWDYCCRKGFYIGPALKHYRCYQVLSKDTRAITISDAVNFRHHNLPGPALSTADKLLGALQHLNTNLANTSVTTCHNLSQPVTTNWQQSMPYVHCYTPPAHNWQTHPLPS